MRSPLPQVGFQFVFDLHVCLCGANVSCRNNTGAVRIVNCLAVGLRKIAQWGIPINNFVPDGDVPHGRTKLTARTSPHIPTAEVSTKNAQTFGQKTQLRDVRLFADRTFVVTIDVVQQSTAGPGNETALGMAPQALENLNLFPWGSWLMRARLCSPPSVA